MITNTSSNELAFYMVRPEPLIDFLAAPLWCASTALTGFASFQMSRTLFVRDKAVALAMHTLLLTLAGIIGTLTVAGAIGLLYPVPLLIAVPTIQFLALVVVRHRVPQPVPADRPKLLGSWTRFVPRRRDLPWAGLWLIVFSFVIAHIVLHGLGYFPFDYDSLMYHIPLVDHWLQTHNLNATDTAHWWLPANNELIALWIVGPFTGDFLIGLNNLPTFCLWVPAAVELGRLLGLSRAARHFGALAIISVQPTFDQVARSASDLAVGVYWLAGLCYALRYLRSRRRADLALYGLSVGLLAGVKYFAVGYAVVLLAATGFAILCCNGSRRAAHGVLLALACAAPFCAYWYLRNTALTGSPLYPMGTGGPLPEVGYTAGLWSTTLFGNQDPDLLRASRHVLLSVMGPFPTFCVLVAPLSLLCLVVSAICTARKRKRVLCRGHSSLLLLALLGSAAVFAVTPFCVENNPGTLNQLYVGQTPSRYGLCFWSTCGAAALYVANGIARCRWLILPGEVAVSLATIACWQLQSRIAATWHWLAHYYDFSAIVLVALSIASIAALLALRARCSWVFRVCAPVLLLAGAGAGTTSLSKQWHAGYAAHFDEHFASNAFSEMERQLPDGARVCVLDDQVYPFYGSRRQFRVCAPRTLTSPDNLLSFLRRERAEFVATRRRDNVILDLYAETPWCVDAFPDRYAHIAGGNGFELRRCLLGPW